MTISKTAFAGALQNTITDNLNSLPPEIISKLDGYLNPSQDREPNLWEAANILGNFYNGASVGNDIRKKCREIIDHIRVFQGQRAVESKDPAPVVFGTSGWRGLIGEDFTIENAHKVVRGIIEMMKSDEFLKTNGYTDFDDVRKAGILLLRDNRFMGDRFLDAAMRELASEKIRIYFVGECPTGVGSAILKELKAAGSINFTPSHNPMEYAGVKFNPGDGGPADKNLTSIIEEKSNFYMKTGSDFVPAMSDFKELRIDIDGKEVFRKFVEEKSIAFDLKKIRSWLKKSKNDLFILVDNMHGSSRGYVQSLLGEDLISELEKTRSIEFIHTDEDYSFHGVKPEPSAANQRPLMDKLNSSGRKLTLAVAMDPDADRIRFNDAEMDIDMNRFAAIAFENIINKGIKGGIVTSVPSSGFAPEIARANQFPFYETPVGFKNFRAALAGGDVAMAFEESDGITFKGHTLEKCALAGFLAALDVMASTGENLSERYNSLCKKYGYFYPERGGEDVKGVSVEAWQKYKVDVVNVLMSGLYKFGDEISIGNENKKIVEINTIDGLKIIFEDKSWILLRPSGTEPKFRYYYELVSNEPRDDHAERLKLYGKTAADILLKARNLVESSAS
ncbi:MAG: phosphomannomutase [Calditrichaceae bacterium]